MSKDIKIKVTSEFIEGGEGKQEMECDGVFIIGMTKLDDGTVAISTTGNIDLETAKKVLDEEIALGEYKITDKELKN